jgi:hypothetical protein
MEYHEAANIFPLDEENIPSLAADIKQHGQSVPIELLDGKIIDGRRRWLACQRAGIEPTTKEVQVDDPVVYVLGLNLERRQLTNSQRAMVAVKSRELVEKYAREAKENKKRKPADSVSAVRRSQNGSPAKTSAKLGRDHKVSARNIERAHKVQQDGIPAVAEAVVRGKLTVTKAAEIAKLPKDEQARAMEETTLPVKEMTEKKSNGRGKMKLLGTGVIRANEAIDCLKRIPKNDALRNRGFQIVRDWIDCNDNGETDGIPHVAEATDGPPVAVDGKRVKAIAAMQQTISDLTRSPLIGIGKSNPYRDYAFRGVISCLRQKQKEK